MHVRLRERRGDLAARLCRGGPGRRAPPRPARGRRRDRIRTAPPRHRRPRAAVARRARGGARRRLPPARRRRRARAARGVRRRSRAWPSWARASSAARSPRRRASSGSTSRWSSWRASSMPSLGPELGEHCARLHRDHGVDLRLGTGVRALRGDARVEARRAERRHGGPGRRGPRGARRDPQHGLAARLRPAAAARRAVRRDARRARRRGRLLRRRHRGLAPPARGRRDRAHRALDASRPSRARPRDAISSCPRTSAGRSRPRRTSGPTSTT